MKFEEVLPALRTGKKIRRTGWKKDTCISIAIKEGCDHYVRYNFGSVFNFNKSDFENDDWEIVKEPKKIKLRDLTKEQYKTFVDNKCGNQIRGIGCVDCPFYNVDCTYGKDNKCWIDNKDLYSDKFLDQEIEVEE